MQLWGDLLCGDVLVVLWQIVALETEGTYPNACAHVNLTTCCKFQTGLKSHEVLPEGVEDGLARRSASDRCILE